jgi:hypothetical protein
MHRFAVPPELAAVVIILGMLTVIVGSIILWLR